MKNHVSATTVFTINQSVFDCAFDGYDRRSLTHRYATRTTAWQDKTVFKKKEKKTSLLFNSLPVRTHSHFFFSPFSLLSFLARENISGKMRIITLDLGGKKKQSWRWCVWRERRGRGEEESRWSPGEPCTPDTTKVVAWLLDEGSSPTNGTYLPKPRACNPITPCLVHSSLPPLLPSSSTHPLRITYFFFQPRPRAPRAQWRNCAPA